MQFGIHMTSLTYDIGWKEPVNKNTNIFELSSYPEKLVCIQLYMMPLGKTIGSLGVGEILYYNIENILLFYSFSFSIGAKEVI